MSTLVETCGNWDLKARFKNFKKCGDITTSADGQLFALSCLLCDAFFLQLESFVDHVQANHINEVLALFADKFITDSIPSGPSDSQPEKFVEIKVESDLSALSESKANNADEDPFAEAPRVEASKVFESENNEVGANLSVDNVTSPVIKEEPHDEEWRPESESSSEYDSMHSDFEWPISKASDNFQSQKASLNPNPVSNEHLKQVAEIYKQYPCLWDLNHEDRKKKRAKSEAQNQMLQKVEEQLNIKMNLRTLNGYISRLRRIYSMEKQNRMKAEESNAPFIPTNEFYDLLRFMDCSTGPYKCEKCSETLTSQRKLRLHMEKHKAKSFVCDICGNEFSQVSFLNRHRTFAHYPRERTHKCTLCSKAFYEMYKYREHMNSHSNIRNYICDNCGKAFLTKKTLLQHKKTHTEKKDFTCTICKKDYARSTSYQSHMKAQH